MDFAQNPLSLFLTLSRYKIKDTYATPQMLDHAIGSMPAKGFTMHELKNMMISCEGRPRPDICETLLTHCFIAEVLTLKTVQRVRLHFAGAGLDRTSINTIYSHVLNPMIASRSYMCIEPIELWLDPKALRRGLVYPVDPETTPSSLLVQDSGMVPVSTQVAIVNPETCMLCHTGEYGEIWVESEACVKTFYGSKDPFDVERFNGKTGDGDPHITYVRTGDLGFLHTVSRPIGPGGAQVEMQILFVLGGIGETFEVNGLSHFPMDIEYSVERCHRNIVSNGSAVFQAGGLVVVLVEVRVKSYLASMVPVIVNAILDEHQLVVDIVAFVGKGDFPRSRLGEKQRGKILASWVTRKMRTIAQFGIRDNDRTGTHHDNSDGMGQQPPTILEGSLMDEKPLMMDLGLPVELADNQAGPAELPTHFATTSATIDEGRSAHHHQWADDNAPNGYGVATSAGDLTAPPRNSKRVSTASHASSSHGGAGGGGEGGSRLMVVGAGGTDRPHSEYDTYPTEAIMHMKLNDGDAQYGTAR